ncbi:MAG: S41 family peptidase [Bacteroidales bacterium]|nr:S41 family peptidase [Bacteroidales bacterium]
MMKGIYVIIICSLLVGCEKVFVDDIPEDIPQENFDYFWNFANENYTFFEYKHINWDSIKTAYQQKVSQDITDDSLFNILAKMTSALKDGHSFLISDVRKYQYYFFLDRPENFDSYVLRKRYLEPNNYEIVYPFEIMELDDIGYIYYGSFENEFTDKQLDYIFNKFSDKKGIIIDIRNNTGGSADYINLLAGRFTDEKVLAGYNQFKNGPGENDYTAKISFYVHPSGNIRFTGDVIVLINRLVFSSANLACVCFAALPNITLIGDKTGGGGGIPRYTELPNGWIFTCSSSIQTLPDGTITEDGIVPDIYESINSAGEGRDGILERAIDELRN